MPKVSIIGAGNVGGLCAARVAELGIAEVVLLDIEKDLCQAKSLDIQDSLTFSGLRHRIKATSDYNLTRNSDIVVVTAGFARRPGMTRDDLLQKNAAIAADILKKVKKFTPNCILIMVANPVDVLTYLALKITKFKPDRVMGMGASLDNARFKSLLIDQLNVPASAIDSLVIGQHGDAMLILSRLAKVDNRQLEKILKKPALRKLIERTKNRGKEIVELFKSGSAYFAPSAAVVQLVSAILNDENKIIPVSCYAKKVYNLGEVCLGLPAVLGAGGIKEIKKLDLNKNELKALKQSAKEIQTNISKIRKLI